MVDVAQVFLAVAAITLVGYLSNRLFEVSRFPDIPLLLLLGLLLGPLNRLAVPHGFGISELADVLNPDILRGVTPFISGLALVVILFDSGLRLDFRDFRKSIGPALVHTLPIFLLTVLGIAAIGHWVLGMEPLVASVLGVALSNVGQTVSAAVMRAMRIPEEAKSIGFVEMAIYDLISIPILVSMFVLAGAGLGGDVVGMSVRSFGQLVSVSLMLGAVSGLLWVYALRRLHGHPNSYMLTLAVLLAVYALNRYLGGSGAVSVLIFGIVIGNREIILRRLHGEKVDDDEEQKVLAFHSEITFFVRTVFFLFLGVSFSIGTGIAWPVSTSIPLLSSLNGRALLFGIGIALVFAWFILARWISIHAVSMRIRPSTKSLIPVFGHGLGTAVLATLPFVTPEYQPGTGFYELFHRWEPVFVNMAFLVILLTVVASSILIFVQERQHGRPPPDTAPAPRSPGAASGPTPKPVRPANFVPDKPAPKQPSAATYPDAVRAPPPKSARRPPKGR